MLRQNAGDQQGARKRVGNLISIGELSRLYDISKRALRLYHEMGLLIPHIVDTDTGYRYYSEAQLPRIELILQMKRAGLQLRQIKRLLDTKDLSVFEAVLGQQMEELDRRIEEYRVYRNSLARQIESFKYIRNPPALDTIFLEYIPRRDALLFPIEPYDFELEYPDGSPWLSALEQVKSVFTEHGVPLALFHQVGCMIPKESLLARRFLCSGAFVCLDSTQQVSDLPRGHIPSNTCVCMYRRYAAMDNVAESRGIRLLLDYIEENDYHIVGPYLAQVIVEPSIFNYSDSEILVKMQIPVRIFEEL